MKTRISVDARTRLWHLSTKCAVWVDTTASLRFLPSKRVTLIDWTQQMRKFGDLARGRKQRSEPFGAACFERPAVIFASCVASLAMSPVSQSRTGQENRLFSGHRGQSLYGGQKFGLFSGRRRLKVVRGQEKGHFYGHSIEFKDSIDEEGF